MLNPVECMEEAPVVALDNSPSRPEPRALWVFSKGQAPYEFRPWRSPCSPHEWPYNLQALRGSEDYEDILAWYFGKQSDVARPEVELFLLLLVDCVGDRPISVTVARDLDLGSYHLRFTVWELIAEQRDDEPLDLKVFFDRWLRTPELDNLLCKVFLRWRECSFEHRSQLSLI